MINYYLRLFVTSALILLCSAHIRAQSSNTNMQISLITCDSGDPLYSKFGHTALRIVYSNTKSDEVYDYGIFNFDDPWFLWKFLKGSLEYKVDQRSFQKFLNEYKLAERSVKAQTLLLSDSEKQAILLILQENLKPENRYYRYDFIEDNCTTRIRDLILREGTPTIDFDEVNASARSYLKGCLEDHKWIGFGIDLLLGSPTDQPLTDHGLLFLPHTLHDKIAENRNGNSSQPWAEQEVILHQAVQSQKSRYITPLQTSLILSFLLAILALTSSRFLDIFHPIMMGLLAVASAFLLIMWLGTSHSLT